MAVEKVEVKNFTLFNHITVKPSKGVNVIIGENGTGKTQLLRLIFSARCMRQNEMHDFVDDPSKKFAPCDYSFFQKSVVWGKADGLVFTRNFTDCTSEDEVSSVQIKTSGVPVADTPPYDPIISDKTSVIEMSTNMFFHPIMIPAKEMLSMSKLIFLPPAYRDSLALPDSLTEIIRTALNTVPATPPELADRIAPKLEKAIQGKVFPREEPSGGISFWVKKNTGKEIPFEMESEGYCKLGLLWKLIMNESITKGTVLLWDEPEANINPNLAGELAEILLELARNGVQIFLATHDYVFAKYFEVLDTDNDSIKFHSLYKTENGIACEEGSTFRDLKNNPIISAFDVLMDEVISKNMGD